MTAREEESACFPSVGRLCKDLSQRGRSLPEPPEYKWCGGRVADKNLAEADVLLQMKTVPVSSLSLLATCFPIITKSVVSVPGAKHRAAAWLQGLEQMGCFSLMLKAVRLQERAAEIRYSSC